MAATVALAALVAAPLAPASAAPGVSAAQAAAGLVDVRTAVPDAIIDMRYATAQNFVGVQLYPTGARCLVNRSMASGLKTAADGLRKQGRKLVFWDCYRPHSVQVRMFQKVPNPTFVAKPGDYSRSHETGRSVDATLADSNGKLIDMGTGFDDFSARAGAFATSDVSATQQANRSALRSAMSAGGLSPYSGEWWHFDGPGAGVDRPIVDVPVT